MLQEIDWTNVVECNQVEIACNGFISKFTGALDQIAPSKQIRIKQRTQPRMSSEILDLINQRDHYLSVFRKSKQKAHYDMFIIFRNQVKYNKMKAKASYYENAVNENKNERVVHSQLNEYLNGNRLIYEFQSGFRNNFSTNTCLINLYDYIRECHNKGNYVGMLLLDLQKAFDTVNHDILLSKLRSIGSDTRTVEWFRSYLTEIMQVTDINGTISSETIITCGVPQGSIFFF